MRKCFEKLNDKAVNMMCSQNTRSFRRADGGIFTLVIGAAIGTLVLIAFYLVAKEGLSSWGTSFKTLVSM